MTSPEKPTPVVVSAGAAGRKRGRPASNTPRKAAVKSTSTVSEKELIEALADCLAVGLEAYFQYLAKVSPNDREDLAMTVEEANAIVTPLGKLIERHASASAAGFVAGSKDWIVAVAAIMSYTDRAAPILRRNAEMRRVERQEAQRANKPKLAKESRNGSVRTDQAEAPLIGAVGAYGLGPQHVQD